MAATAVAAPPSAASGSRLLVTPYTAPRDVLLWNRDAESWLRVDIGNELEPTVDWLAEEIVRQHRLKFRTVRIFAGNGRLLSRADLQRPIDYYTFDNFLSFTSRYSRGCMQILVKSVVGDTLTLDMKPKVLVEDVVKQMEELDGARHDRVIFAGKQLEHERTLDSYGITRGQTLFLVNRLLGGGDMPPSTFVDMSNEAGLQRCQWAPSAPKWREAGNGLNLEGLCTNSDCEAYNKMVIMRIGMGVFDVLLDSDAETTCCPCCSEFVQPLTCAFSRCEWKWAGLKASARGNPAQRTQSLDWSNAGDEYVRFSEADVKDGGSGLVAWLRLKIHTRYPVPASRSRPQAEERECSICMVEDGEDAWASTPCSHHFHAECLNVWKVSRQKEGRVAGCPKCRLPLH